MNAEWRVVQQKCVLLWLVGDPYEQLGQHSPAASFPPAHQMRLKFYHLYFDTLQNLSHVYATDAINGTLLHTLL